jgi:hypothetical protein
MNHDVQPAGLAGRIRSTWNENPLVIIMGLAVLFRLLAAVFARGWGMLDDHFLVIEPAQSWVYGYDSNFWLPSSEKNEGPTGHNFFYPGFHYFLFLLMKWIHLNDPQCKMLVVRLIHASFSLITVYCGYRITEVMEGRKSARLAGILLALCFFMPWISVRNLVEAVCVPFLMLAFWQLINPRKNDCLRKYLVAGLLFGLAADIRYQALLFPAGLALWLFAERKWREVLSIGIGIMISFVLVQALIDVAIWGYPFAEFIGYARVNVTDRHSYFNLPWYNYFLTVGGIILPPVSLFFFYGFFRGWRKYAILFFPAALFFIFHSWFPNKQERFILPFIPFFIMIGSMGYDRYVAGSSFWMRRKKTLRACWVFFWTLNLILLTGVTFVYSKRAQVESMYYLSGYPYVRTIVVEDENGNVPIAPLFYTGKWPRYPKMLPTDTTVYQRVSALAAGPRLNQPQFFIFTGSRDLRKRVAMAKSFFPLLVYETTIEPGFIDKLMHRLNPVNKANRIYIFRNSAFYKTKQE